jgi:hypothetical protein|tara:strand:+ start:107 stop:391 length:285 start_codon:yes stop_codon:yes gene_type:complete
MTSKLSVKRKEPVPGNSFTADWTSTREERRVGNWLPSTADQHPSTVAEFDIELTNDEDTCLYNGFTDILDDMLRKRLNINLLDHYDLVKVVREG